MSFALDEHGSVFWSLENCLEFPPSFCDTYEVHPPTFPFSIRFAAFRGNVLELRVILFLDVLVFLLLLYFLFHYFRLNYFLRMKWFLYMILVSVWSAKGLRQVTNPILIFPLLCYQH